MHRIYSWCSGLHKVEIFFYNFRKDRKWNSRYSSVERERENKKKKKNFDFAQPWWCLVPGLDQLQYWIRVVIEIRLLFKIWYTQWNYLWFIFMHLMFLISKKKDMNRLKFTLQLSQVPLGENGRVAELVSTAGRQSNRCNVALNDLNFVL